ncbi:MAG: hypothetical protein U0704_12740 [Candidatus Eisenbacteria bacterium]
MSVSFPVPADAARPSWFPRTIVVGGLLAIALLLTATTLRGIGSSSDLRHDDRPVQLDR